MAIYQSGVIFADVDTADPNCWRLDSYVKRGGYTALKKIFVEKIRSITIKSYIINNAVID